MDTIPTESLISMFYDGICCYCKTSAHTRLSEEPWHDLELPVPIKGEPATSCECGHLITKIETGDLTHVPSKNSDYQQL